MERKLRKSCESSVQSRTVEERTDRRQRGNAGRGNIWGARKVAKKKKYERVMPNSPVRNGD